MNEPATVPSRSFRGASIPPVIASLSDWSSATEGSGGPYGPITAGVLGDQEGAGSGGLARLPGTYARTAVPREPPLVVGQLSYHRAAGHAETSRVKSDPAEHDETTSAIWSTQPADEPADLSDALRDLQDVALEALEEGLPQPSETAMKNATRLVRAIYGLYPCRLEVYPTADGEVAIDTPSQHGASVIVLCEAAGGALCLVNTGDASRRARYSKADQLPDGFLKEALAELAHRNQNAA